VTTSALSNNDKKNYSSLAAIQASASTSQLVDILLTDDWPVSIAQFSAAPLPDPQLASIGAAPLSDVIRKTKPRYHFAAGGGHPPKFWEREPFLWMTNKVGSPGLLVWVHLVGGACSRQKTEGALIMLTV